VASLVTTVARAQKIQLNLPSNSIYFSSNLIGVVLRYLGCSVGGRIGWSTRWGGQLDGGLRYSTSEHTDPCCCCSHLQSTTQNATSAFLRYMADCIVFARAPCIICRNMTLKSWIPSPLLRIRYAPRTARATVSRRNARVRRIFQMPLFVYSMFQCLYVGKAHLLQKSICEYLCMLVLICTTVQEQRVHTGRR
jgi:hypothetical protein